MVPMPARLVLAALAGLLALAGISAPAPAAAAAAPARALTVSPAVPLPGEHVTVSGTVAGGSRSVQLQQRVGSAWQRLAAGRSSRTGAFAFHTALTRSTALRVLAPKAGKRAKTITAARAVTVAAPTARLTLSGTGGTTAAARVEVAPVRPGRPVVLEVLEVLDGTWRTAGATRTLPASGVVTWSLSGLPVETVHRYRVRVGAWRGAPPYASAVVPFGTDFPTWAVPEAAGSLSIVTAGGVPIESKVEYVDATMTLDGVTQDLRIRGRGNSTWSWPKKPYRIKLDAATPLFGLPADKDWVLLANHGDPSLLRNWSAFALADRTRIPWSPHGHFVDVTLNGTAIGSYLLVEAIEQSSDRVDLAEDGLLLEVDERYSWSGEPGFTTDRGMPIAYKDPDDPTDAQIAALREEMNAMETALASIGTDDPVDWRPYVDTATFVDWYLVSELFKNLDGDFYSSVYVTWRPGEPFAMGPVWDFDLSSGFDGWFGEEYPSPEGWYIRGDDPGPGDHPRHETHWLARLMDDPAFEALVAARWRELSPVVHDLVMQYPVTRALLSTSGDMDRALWPERPWGGMEHGSSFGGEVRYLAGWLGDRAAWLDEQFA